MVKQVVISDIDLEPNTSVAPVQFVDDDIEPQVLLERESGQTQTAAERLAALKKSKGIVEQPAQPATPVVKEDESRGFFGTVGAVAKDVAGGISEAKTRMAVGAIKAVDEVRDTVQGLFGLETDGDIVDIVAKIAESDELKAKTITGQGIEAITQFSAGFIPATGALKAMGMANTMYRSMAAGAVADAAVFDAHEERLSNLVQSVPALQNPVTEYLASNEDDSILEGKFKNALEGLALGGIVDVIFKGVKAIKSRRKLKAEADEEGTTVEQKVAEADTSPENLAEKAEQARKAYEQNPSDENLKAYKEARRARDDAGQSASDAGDTTSYRMDHEAPVSENDVGLHDVENAMPDFYGRPDEYKTGSNLDDESIKIINDLKGKPDEQVVVYRAVPIDAPDTINFGDWVSINRKYAEEHGEGIPGGYKIIQARTSAKNIKNNGDSIHEYGFADESAKPPKYQDADEYIPFSQIMDEQQIELDVPDFKTGATDAADVEAKNINLNRLESEEDIQTLIDKVAEADAPNINQARRQKINNEELPKLADDLGMSVEDLLARKEGQAFNAEQILAARKILVASAENLINLAKRAANGSDVEIAVFRRAMAQHRAIQNQVSGMTAEAGRALQQFNVVAKSGAEQAKAIEEMLSASGGREMSQTMAKMISEIDDPRVMGKAIKDMNKATTMDMLYEAWINGLLSSPTTHMVNIMSNMVTTILAVGERHVASMIGKNIEAGEATAQMVGMLEGSIDGLRLAWHTIKTGEPQDVLEKVEVAQRVAISAENLNASGMAGRFVDFIGAFVRLPGRMLSAGDAFFKSVGYRMELHALAHRKAMREGLKGEEYAKRKVEIMENPPKNIRMAAVDASRYQTFTNELGDFGKGLERIRNSSGIARVVVPFLRTPVNIMSYAFERTPLAPLRKQFRDDVKKGGPERDMALAKMITGSTIMATAGMMAASGHITGAGPVDRKMKNLMRANGWQPYSIKVGDKYYAYNRLDPVGALIGLAADVTEITGQTTDAGADEIAAAAVLSVVQNMASKTYMSGVMDMFDALFSSSTDPEAKNWKLNNYIQRLGGSAVPAMVTAIERQLSPEMSATYSILDTIKSRIPGYSKDLPPRRNMFGDIIYLEGGIGPDMLSPMYVSTDRKDPVITEMIEQGASISMPLKVMGEVELDPLQYDRLILLTANTDKSFAPLTLKEALGQIMKTPGYKMATDGPEGGKANQIRTIVQKYKEAAKIQLQKEYPELQESVINKKIEKFENLSGRKIRRLAGEE